jgi:hypothetical protein
LVDACKGLRDRKQQFLKGLADLDRHRANYGPDGIQQLQVLWWEFPSERWIELRRGCPMNFLAVPRNNVAEPDKDMTSEQLDVAVQFTDELVKLGVLCLPPSPAEIKAITPLFCLPKPGQPGEWRILGDMKRGGQNEAIGKDPVYLNRPDTVLPHMYSGGYSAVGDASKFFYQFPTAAEDRPYLGVRHPGNQLLYWYLGLPMGSANSPAISGRMGAAFIRLLLMCHPDIFSGDGVSNTWRDKFSGRTYDPKLGHGYVLISPEDGLPAVLVWAHIDDFLIHGPTYEKTARAMQALMDKALDIGLLFNPTKITPPTKAVKYCGFIYDTTHIPSLRIPTDKRLRALALLKYVLDRSGQAMSRLALAVLYGVLQALVPATPANLGQTFLRRSYNILYAALDSSSDYVPAEIFYSTVILDIATIQDLVWWIQALQVEVYRPTRYERAATLAPGWGDGSGTGSGGTLRIAMGPTAQWMGVWLLHVSGTSSNWKELRTLLQMLEDLVKRNDDPVRGMTVFYFTDNSTVYYAVQKGSSNSTLHSLIVRIKLAELQLGCLLEAIHVPGTVMIVQGTDGLSRGVWVSPLHTTVNPVLTTAQVFDPIPFTSALTPWVLQEAGLALDTPVTFRPWNGRWTARPVLHRTTIWCPPPEMARQLLCFLLGRWVESPWDTSALLVIPRVLQRQWMNLSKHVTEVGLYQPSEFPFSCLQALPIPVVVLHIATYQRSLPSPSEPDDLAGLDAPSLPPNAKWHRQQAECLRRL